MYIYLWSLSVSISSITLHMEIRRAAANNTQEKSTMDSPFHLTHVLTLSVLKSRRSSPVAFTSVLGDPEATDFALNSPRTNQWLVNRWLALKRNMAFLTSFIIFYIRDRGTFGGS